MESTIKKKINTFGKVGKIITSIIIVVLLVVEGFLLAGTIVAAVLPKDAVSVDAQGGGTVRFDAEYFGFDSDELSLKIGSTQIKLAEFDSVKTHSQDGSVIMDVQSGEFHFNLNTLLGLMIIGIIRLASFVVALYFLKALMKAYAPDASFASWAIRFAASLDGVLTVLSGMSNEAQMRDNLSFMADFKPLNAEERDIIRRSQEIMDQSGAIQCTGCGYCLEGCPLSIPISEVFEAANLHLVSGQTQQGKEKYAQATQGKGRAGECVGCKNCESVCPQHLEITQHLKTAASLFDHA